jgi:PAS domain S-box-containing protein
MSGPVRILHLEDDDADRRLVEARLREEGFRAEFTAVAEWLRFLDALKHDRFDLILADFRLPGFDGLQALDECRTHRPEKPFVFVTGSMGEELAVESLKQGAVDYVLKANLARLGPAVRRALADAEERARRQRAEEDLHEAQRIALLGSWRWYAECDTVAASDGFLRIFGLEPAQGVPRLREQRGRLYPAEAWERLHQATLEVLRTGGRHELDVEALRGQTPIWVTACVEPVRDPRGNIIGLRGTVQDTTARKQTEENLRAANRELSRFNQATLGRELRIIELKKQVNSLAARLSEPPIYQTDFGPERPRPTA